MDKKTKNLFKVNNNSNKESKKIYDIIIKNLNNEKKLDEITKNFKKKIIEKTIKYKNIKLTIDPYDYIIHIINKIKYSYNTEEILNLKNQKTLLDSSKKILKKIKVNDKIYEFEILKIPKNTNIFKSISEFQNEDKNKSYWDDNVPTFYGSYLSAISFSTYFLNVYKLEKDIFLFDMNSKINYENINLLFPQIKNYYNKKIINTNNLNKIFNYYINCNTIICKKFKGDHWLHSYLLSNIIKELFLIKKLPIYEYNVASYYITEDKNIFEKFKIILDKLNLDGFFAGLCFNPLSMLRNDFGINLEEIILYKKNNVLKIDITNPLDTHEIIKKKNLNIPSNFNFDHDYIWKNQNNQLLKFYSKNLNLYPPIIPKNNYIFTLNVHRFRSINSNDETINNLINLIKKINASFVLLPESLSNIDFPKEYKIFNAKTEDLKNKDCLTLLYKNIIVKNIFEKKLPNIVNTIRKMIYLKTHDYTYIFTHLEVKDGSRINQLKFILQYNPDFIVGDLNFKQNSEEYKFLLNNGFTTLNSNLKTTPFRITVDYIWFKENKNFIQTIIPYPFSDHRGVLLSHKK